MNEKFAPRPRADRVAVTIDMIQVGGTDKDRWASRFSLASEWSRRAAITSQYINPASTVLDVGAGAMDLRRCLPPSCVYVPADIVEREPGCIVIDLNKGEFPAVAADVVTMLGVLEYVHDIGRVLLAAHGSGSKLIVSYCAFHGFGRRRRRGLGWVNDLSLSEFKKLLGMAGWTIAKRRLYKFRLTMSEHLFICHASPVQVARTTDV